MKSLLTIAILGTMMNACGGTGEIPKQNRPTPSSTAPAPKTLDEQALQAQLIKLVNEITEGAVKGNTTLLAKNSTDDFEMTGVDGKKQTKKEALAEVKKEKSVKSFTITEALLVANTDDTAELQYNLNVTLNNERTGTARVTDTFVKKDGRWLLKSELQTILRR